MGGVMNLLFLSEYCGEKRTAQVFKNVDSLGFTVQCYEHSKLVQQEILFNQTASEDFAEDWVLCH
jgi:hypothetical protein